MPAATAPRASRRASPTRAARSRTPRPARSAAGRPPQPDVYEEVTNRIVAELEAGVFPWTRPWDPSKATAGGGAFALPRNPTTGNCYTGVNVLLCWIAMASRGYASNLFLTYRQAQSVGAQVRRGEASIAIVKAGTFTPKGEREAARAEDRDPQAVPFLKTHRVFNAEQIDGLPDELVAPPPPPDLSQTDARVRAILDGLGCRVVHGTPEACYMPATDTIRLPSPDQFGGDTHQWASVLAHEAVHCSGSEGRLARDLTGAFGSASYFAEEVTAELGASYVCAALGIAPRVRHADYIGAWIKTMKADKRCVVRAASAASKAADYLLALVPEGDDGEAMLAKDDSSPDVRA